MVTVKVNLGGVNFAERLAALPGEARKRINSDLSEELKIITVDMFSEENAEHRPVKWPKKADDSPATLVRSTTLRRSFFTLPTSESGVVATNTKYAAQHQFGGSFTVPAHDRTIRQAFGRPIEPPKTIRVRQYQMTVPARPFFPFDEQGNLTPYAEGILVETAENSIERELSR